MVSRRRLDRRAGVRPSGLEDRDSGGISASAVPVEEGLVSDPDTLPKPAGFGTEASTSSGSFVLLDEYEVDELTLARLREISMSIESNGAAKASVAGTTYGPYTGAVDVSIPLDPGVLTEGYKVRVFHRSTDGTSTSTLGQLSVLEV